MQCSSVVRNISKTLVYIYIYISWHYWQYTTFGMDCKAWLSLGTVKGKIIISQFIQHLPPPQRVLQHVFMVGCSRGPIWPFCVELQHTYCAKAICFKNKIYLWDHAWLENADNSDVLANNMVPFSNILQISYGHTACNLGPSPLATHHQRSLFCHHYSNIGKEYLFSVQPSKQEQSHTATSAYSKRKNQRTAVRWVQLRYSTSHNFKKALPQSYL